MMAITTRSSINVKPATNPPLALPAGELSQQKNLLLARAHCLRIAEGGGAFGETFPDILPIRAPGGDDSALKHAFNRIAEGGSAVGQPFPDIFPIRTGGGDDSALKNAFNWEQGSRVFPAVNLGVAIGVGNYPATGVAAGRQVGPEF